MSLDQVSQDLKQQVHSVRKMLDTTHEISVGLTEKVATLFVSQFPEPFTLVAERPVQVGALEAPTLEYRGKALNLATNRVALAQMTYITPILSLVIISIVLGEVIGLLTVGGLVLIIAGILVSSLKRV